MLGKDKEREDYQEFSNDLYEHGIFCDKNIVDIKEDDKYKDYDDFNLEIKYFQQKL